MVNNNPYAQYANNKVLTASKQELPLLLYEGALKFGNIAKTAMENKDIQKASDNLKKVQRIIGELNNTLNMKYPVAKDFERVYDYLLDRLVDCHLTKDPEDMEEVLTHIRTMRDTWKEVMRICREENQGVG